MYRILTVYTVSHPHTRLPFLPWKQSCFGHTEKGLCFNQHHSKFYGQVGGLFSPNIYIQGMTEENIYMIVVNVSDVDKRPCSIDKSNASTSLRRCDRRCTCMYYVCMHAYKKFAVEALSTHSLKLYTYHYSNFLLIWIEWKVEFSQLFIARKVNIFQTFEFICVLCLIHLE